MNNFKLTAALAALFANSAFAASHGLSTLIAIANENANVELVCNLSGCSLVYNDEDAEEDEEETIDEMETIVKQYSDGDSDSVLL